MNTIEKALEDQALATRIGDDIARILQLKRDSDYPDRWETAWGNKTSAGLARTVARILKYELESTTK